jgi:phosphodiesterase/alkaline phosphatase D-like protein
VKENDFPSQLTLNNYLVHDLKTAQTQWQSIPAVIMLMSSHGHHSKVFVQLIMNMIEMDRGEVLSKEDVLKIYKGC